MKKYLGCRSCCSKYMVVEVAAILPVVVAVTYMEGKEWDRSSHSSRNGERHSHYRVAAISFRDVLECD
jgi:hypothetical protein